MTLSLTPSTIRELAQNRAVTAEFPFLAAYKPPPPGCCGKVAQGPDPRRAAAAIAALPAARKARFKALTGADRVVGQTVKAGRVVPIEF